MQTSQRTALKKSISSGYSLPITRNPSHSRAVQLPSKLKGNLEIYKLLITNNFHGGGGVGIFSSIENAQLPR
jgi:hypothetical protein